MVVYILCYLSPFKVSKHPKDPFIKFYFFSLAVNLIRIASLYLSKYFRKNIKYSKLRFYVFHFAGIVKYEKTIRICQFRNCELPATARRSCWGHKTKSVIFRIFYNGVIIGDVA